MVFSSITFLCFFFPITFIVYYALPKVAKNGWLLLTSLIFFAWAQPRYVWIILINVLINYLGGMILGRLNRDSDKKGIIHKLILVVIVSANLLILFYFKYFDFVVESVNQIFHSKHWVRGIILPIGISFFTFQGMSYSIDVYRGTVSVQKNPFKLALYIMLFPQLVAGPIVRYSDVEADISERKVSVSDVSDGIARFIAGLSKKVLLANTFAELTDSIWNSAMTVGDNTVATAWLGAIAYTLQIYFDFSGYSDMAIGMGQMLGFRFPENFNLPYISKSISEFWRRWHISLSAWFRDYVYIPLGGNRRHVYLNLIIVFLFTGIWHGAAWQFIAWGIWHGLFILAERYFNLKNHGKGIKLPVISHLYAMGVVIIGWVFFRAPSIMAALNYIGNMFGIGLSPTPRYSVLWYLGRWNVFFLIIGLVLGFGVHIRAGERLKAFAGKNNMSQYCVIIAKNIALIGLLVVDLMRLMFGIYNPFIYFIF